MIHYLSITILIENKFRIISNETSEALSSRSNIEDKYKNLKYTGLDLDKGTVRNNLEAGVLEPMICKIKALKFATEATISIL